MHTRQHEAAHRHSGWLRASALLAASCAILIMVCVLGGAIAQWRGAEPPAIDGQVGMYRIVAFTTNVPTCSPAVPCTQQFADVPLPRYYVVWAIPADSARSEGRRLLTIPLRLPFAR